MTEEEWQVTTDLSLLRQCLFRKVDPVSHRKLRLFVVACCRRIWPMLSDSRSRRAVEAAEGFADGQLTRTELAACRKGAREAVKETRDADAGAGTVMASRAAAESAAPGRQEAGAASGHAAQAVASARHYGTGGSSDRPISGWYREIEAEQRAQVPLFRDVFGNVFRPVTLDPFWITPTVVSLAEAAYEERIQASGELTGARLGILADALEEAGCADADVLSHLRGPGPHVRGCWALDLVLGRG